MAERIDAALYESYFEQHKMVKECSLIATVIRGAMIVAVRENAGTGKIAEFTVSIENGKARINLKSSVEYIRTRQITCGWSELKRFYDWFLGLPPTLAEKTKDDDVAGFALAVGSTNDLFVVDDQILEVTENEN